MVFNLKNLNYKHKKRLIKSIALPERRILSIKDVFQQADDYTRPNLKVLKKHIENEGRLEIDLVLKLIDLVEISLRKEKNLLILESPINIVGDIHGQFYDLLTILTLGGSPDKINYLFMGDFVDRGLFSFECICYLYALKIVYPKKIFFIRGNHESRHLTKYFTFRDECLLKSNKNVYDKFMSSFDSLPIAAIIDSKFFCVHGGLSPNFSKISELDEINRFKEIPRHGLLCDLTWSDPIDSLDSVSKRTSTLYLNNPSRGCSFLYTPKAIEKFLNENNLISIIRAHQVQREGIKLSKCFLDKINFPSLISVFSAPNYCDVYGNKASILQYKENNLTIKLFTAADHPFVLPNFLNAFTWSLPFVFEKLNDILLSILNYISDEEVFRKEIDKDKYEYESEDKIKNDGFLRKVNILRKNSIVLKNNSKLSKSSLKLGTLVATNNLRRRSSDADKEILNNFEANGIESFEDANKLDNLQYKIVNSD